MNHTSHLIWRYILADHSFFIEPVYCHYRVTFRLRAAENGPKRQQAKEQTDV
jgi:hypothetical protein